MRTYGILQTKFWAWAKGRGLSRSAREMATYLVSSPHTTGIGCFRAPVAYIADDLDTVPEDVRATLAELVTVGFLEYDATESWVWLVDFLDHNPIANPNVAKSFMPVIEGVPKTVAFYGRFLAALERSAKRFPNGFIDRLRNGVPNQEQDQSQEQEQEQEQEGPEADASAGSRFDPAGDDPKAVLFGAAVRGFVGRQTRKPPDVVGRLIGKWCREFEQDHAALLTALGKAQDDPPGNLIEWMGGAVRRHTRPSSDPYSADYVPKTVEQILAERDNDPVWRGVQ
jgi:hypothetical protein